jgi:hypothetical protein
MSNDKPAGTILSTGVFKKIHPAFGSPEKRPAI